MFSCFDSETKFYDKKYVCDGVLKMELNYLATFQFLVKFVCLLHIDDQHIYLIRSAFELNTGVYQWNIL